ncbi:hypothetical protein QE363_001000 [Sphingomonas sp. SORGH_AS870]|uniref:hypothetical protein n=1 Tax=Sphingomonas sp. SORGH_AS_0870 TaxID=3041801 RepID=UPI0028675823|nr:hypothetical protein [Sphingomonas sp. SORGH_AS_0870]MDR6145207.1 hypothetical protein [Sphingomonas sp. SORGH_AS_0870]
MDPMFDPDLIEYVDDATLLTALATIAVAPERGDRTVILAEIARRDLGPLTITHDPAPTTPMIAEMRA